nr:uncharacterized protein LOC111420061 [Onthophagus taurus]
MPGKKMEVRRLGEPTDTLHIRGMDASMEKWEVREAIEAALGVKNMDMQTSELRPMRNDTQAITVTMDTKQAETLMRGGPIKIGLTRCYIERRIKLERCFRCWGYGHTAKDCKEDIDRSKLCFKCGKENHDQGVCKNKEACPLCKVDGHKAGTGRCKAFMAALSLVRKADRKVNGT